jgi:hypothetical protein
MCDDSNSGIKMDKKNFPTFFDLVKAVPERFCLADTWKGEKELRECERSYHLPDGGKLTKNHGAGVMSQYLIPSDATVIVRWKE